MKKNRKEKNIYLNKKIVFFIMIILIAYLVNNAWGKYVAYLKSNHAIESSKFYFKSNIANVEEGKKFDINEWDYTENLPINFNVINYENTLLVTKEDIDYNITAETMPSSTGNVILKIKNGTKEINSTNLEKLEGQNCNKNDYILEVIPKDINSGDKIEIKLTIKSNKPYVKEIVSYINITADSKEENKFKLEESSNKEYVTLYVKANNNENLNIEYDNTKLILDKSNYLVENVSINKNNTKSNFSVSNIEKGKNYEITFIKKDNNENITLGSDIEIK